MGLFAVTIDTPAAADLARFYAELLGTEVTYDGPEGSMLTTGGSNLMFQQVAEYTPPKWPDPSRPQQAHLDLIVDDADEGEALALKLGASRLPSDAESFRVFADPHGHTFCLVPPG
jgi:hypothetical protein